MNKLENLKLFCKDNSELCHDLGIALMYFMDRLESDVDIQDIILDEPMSDYEFDHFKQRYQQIYKIVFLLEFE